MNQSARVAPSLRTALIVRLVLLVTLTAGLIGYISLLNGQRAAEDLANQLQKQTLAGVTQKLGDYLALPHMLNRLNAEMVRRDSANITDVARLRAEYIRQLRAFDPAMTVAFGAEQGGEYVGVGRRDSDTYESGLMQRAIDNTYRVYLLDSQGTPLQVLTETPNYDARTRSWYQTGVKAGKAAWSPIYVWASQTNIGITAVLPIYDDTGALLGVQQSALSLKYIGDFLAGLRIGQSGQVFLVERSGLLVASSAPEKPIRPGQNSADLVRFKATESADPFTRTAAGHLTAQFGDLSRIPDDYQARVDVAGQRFFVSTASLRDPHGLDWLLVVGVPESDFMARVEANTRSTILLCVIAALVALALGILTAHRITQPILRLNAAAKELAQGRWEQQVTVKRRDEVGELAASFNWMAAQLGELFATLEQRVAQRTTELVAANRELQQEVTERKQAEEALRESEERYQLANRATFNAIWDWNLQTNVLWWNENFQTHFGYCAEEIEPGIESWTNRIHPEDLASVEAGIHAAIDSGRQSWSDQYRFRSKNGTYAEIDDRGYISREASGKPVRMIGAMQDISERKQAEQRAFELALERERMALLTQFILDVSHEFRTPLSIMQTNIYLLERLEDPAKRQRKLAQIGEQVTGITRLVELLVEMARLDSGVPFTTQSMDLNGLVGAIAGKLQAQAAAKGLTLYLELASDLPPVPADGNRLDRALHELLNNAVRYTPTGGSITLRTASGAAGVTVEVQDSGPGIAADVLPHIFERFYRQDVAHTTPGFGLGLPIARAIVERHGGRLEVESQPGAGSVFRIKLPA
ncbi:MAG: ATP-binding protein [Chloroflexi bacterium]|nr:ATP-binding protein [Chloroflexota bacterium]